MTIDCEKIITDFDGTPIKRDEFRIWTVGSAIQWAICNYDQDKKTFDQKVADSKFASQLKGNFEMREDDVMRVKEACGKLFSAIVVGFIAGEIDRAQVEKAYLAAK